MRSEVDRLRAALTAIRDTDPVDNALDPQRPARLAAAALNPCPMCDGSGDDGLLPYSGCSPCGGSGVAA